MTKENISSHYVVAALYRFFNFPDYRAFREPLLNFCIEQGLRGTFLLAGEGINGTIAGTRAAIDGLRQFLQSHDLLAGMEYKESSAAELPFHRMKVKLKKEIVTLGVCDLDPEQGGGIRLDAAGWNAVINDPDTLVIDTRNQYEFEIGTFKNAVSPNTETFREFPAYVKQHLDPQRHRKIAMFCTGGIRCEKASALLLKQGFEQVYQLQGGILRYLEEVSEADNLWQGECFVFDGRVAVDEKLAQGSYEQCFACRRPVSAADVQSDKFRQGVSCPACFDDVSEERRSRLEERQKQVRIAEARGDQHIGVPMKHQS